MRATSALMPTHGPVMRQIWNATRKDLSRARRDPIALLMWMAIPLILGTLITAVFGGGNATPQGRLLVADEDDTFLSNALAAAFSREPLSKMVLVEKVSRDQGRARIDRGDGSALLIVPKGLADAVFNDTPFSVELFTNPSQRIMPKIIQEVLSILVEAEFYLHRVADRELRTFTLQRDRDRPPTDVEISLYSVSVNHAIDRLRKYLIPPAIQLQTVVAKENTSGKSFGSILFPTFMFMAVLFSCSSLAADIWKERTAGTLRRLLTTPTSPAAFLGGRLLFVLSLFTAIALAAVSVGHWIAGVPVANFPAAVAWLAFSGASLYLLLLFVVMQAGTQRSANVLANLVVFPMSMLGGSFFPFDSMPAWMVRIGTKLPNGWAIVQFYDILDGTVKFKTLAAAAAGLLAIAVVAFALALRKLKRGFAL